MLLHPQRNIVSDSSEREFPVELPGLTVGCEAGGAVGHYGVVGDVDRVLGERALVAPGVAGCSESRSISALTEDRVTSSPVTI